MGSRYRSWDRESEVGPSWNRFWNRKSKQLGIAFGIGVGNRGPMEAEVESRIEASWKPKRNRGSGIEATWKPKWNRGSGSQLLLGIGVPFLTWFRNRLSDPGPVLRNSGSDTQKYLYDNEIFFRCIDIMRILFDENYF